MNIKIDEKNNIQTNFFRPPVIRVSDKVLIPQEEHPDINFVGLLIGPRGNTLKAMEKETGAKIIIRGKGSVKEGKVGRKDGQPLPGEDEPLHAFITASNPECVKKAVDKIKEVIRQGIEVPEGHNDLRRMQLRELAQLNGTLRESDCPRCNNCGSTDHKSWYVQFSCWYENGIIYIYFFLFIGFVLKEPMLPTILCAQHAVALDTLQKTVVVNVLEWEAFQQLIPKQK